MWLNSRIPLFHTSSDLNAHCAGTASSSIPSPAICTEHSSTFHPRASCSPCPIQAAAPRPLHPIPRANPFPKVTGQFCRLPLPTLLYKLEAANLGDLMRLWVRTGVQINVHLWLFKDSWRHTKHVRKQSALPTRTPSSSQSVFRAPRG